MFARISFLIILIFALTSVAASAQTNVSTNSNAADASKATSRERGGDDNDSPAGLSMRETREKWRLEAEEKEHRELLDRSEKAAQLSDELKKSFVQNNAFSNNDVAKLTELEKLVKKIRKNLGGGGDENEAVDESKPASLAEAFNQLSEAGASLRNGLKKQTRHEISADSIDKSNAMLDLIGLIRNFAQPK